MKYRIKGIATKTQPRISIRRWGDFQARNYDYAERRLKQNNPIFTRKIFCCRVANSIDFYLSSSLSSVYFSKSKLEFKSLNFFEFKYDKNINGSTLLNICHYKINKTINDNTWTIIDMLFIILLKVKNRFLNSSNTINNVLFCHE